MKHFRPSRRTLVPAIAVLTVLGAVALYLFQPWKAFVDRTVNESLPAAAAAAPEPGGGDGEVDDSEAGDGNDGNDEKESGRTEQSGGIRELARGGFVSHEHDTSGTARTLRLADGGLLLRLEGLETSDGPDVRVYLSTRDADAAEDGLGEGAVELARLKGNIGDQNYTVPAGTDLSRFRSAVLWCERFSVSFGAADLVPGDSGA